MSTTALDLLPVKQPGANPAYSIVLVNHKTLEITKICLELLREGLRNKDVPVWVVDNYSNDASTEYLRSLGWINLLERESPGAEAGHIAHGQALDMALARVTTDYLFLLHTDTFVYDANVFDMMLEKCARDDKVVAVGCVEQLSRGFLRAAWRSYSRLAKYYFRKFKLFAGLPARDPSRCLEVHLRSFCTLWNVHIIKSHGLRFLLNDRIPGYELQDKMLALGYNVEFLSARKIFKYLDHIQAGTSVATGNRHKGHRRTKLYNNILKKIISGQ